MSKVSPIQPIAHGSTPVLELLMPLELAVVDATVVDATDDVVEPWLVVVIATLPVLPPAPPVSTPLPFAQDAPKADRLATSPRDATVVPRRRFDGMREMLFERVGRGKPNHASSRGFRESAVPR